MRGLDRSLKLIGGMKLNFMAGSGKLVGVRSTRISGRKTHQRRPRPWEELEEGHLIPLPALQLSPCKAWGEPCTLRGLIFLNCRRTIHGKALKLEAACPTGWKCIRRRYRGEIHFQTAGTPVQFVKKARRATLVDFSGSPRRLCFHSRSVKVLPER